jgi:hypothetical protein
VDGNPSRLTNTSSETEQQESALYNMHLELPLADTEYYVADKMSTVQSLNLGIVLEHHYLEI